MSAKSEQMEQELNGQAASSSGVCASCGITAIDNVKLKKCACNLVKYCSVDCQKNDRSRHKKACKKRLAELRVKQLFTQPDISYLGECPICCLPLHLDPSKSPFMTCCSKVICNGCYHANWKREMEGGLEHKCPFCREPVPESPKECNKQVMERVKKNDPVAMTQMAKNLRRKGDYGKALEYWTKAAELGDVGAHCSLGGLYYSGDGVEKDEERAVYHLEQAAIGGHPDARRVLADYEKRNGKIERAAKHVIIAANLGCDLSLKHIKALFMQGVVSKEEYAAALRAHQAAVDATKSAEREKAEAYSKARDALLHGVKGRDKQKHDGDYDGVTLAKIMSCMYFDK